MVFRRHYVSDGPKSAGVSSCACDVCPRVEGGEEGPCLSSVLSTWDRGGSCGLSGVPNESSAFGLTRTESGMVAGYDKQSFVHRICGCSASHDHPSGPPHAPPP